MKSLRALLPFFAIIIPLGGCGGGDDLNLAGSAASAAGSGGAGAGGAEMGGAPGTGGSGASGSGAGGAGTGGAGAGGAEVPGVLPVLVVDTSGQPIQQEVKVDAAMYVVEDHDGTLMDIESRPRTWDGFIGIEVRGSSSTSFPKKSYGIETRGPDGLDIDVPLLGMPEEADWVLYGPYTDKTYMRDKLAYDVGRELGRYTPRSRFVEVVLNGDYRGVYVFIEKIKRGPDRLPIPKVAPDAASGDITGGYIIKREDGSAAGGWYSAEGTPWQYHYPKADDITPEQEAYLQGHVDAFEAAMSGGPGFADPVNGYVKWIDVPSFVDFAIMMELSRNVDGYRKSAYMHKDIDAKGGRFYMGPLWDFNIAFGNADYCAGESIQGFQYAGGACQDQERIPAWWKLLMADPAFKKALRCRWEELRKGTLSDAKLIAKIDAYREEVKVAEPRDHMKWETLGTYVWPNPFIGQTFADEIGYLKQWLTDRAAWLDQKMPGTCP
jgi:hypothetical protein